MQSTTPTVRRAFLAAIIQAVLARSPTRIITELRQMSRDIPKLTTPYIGRRVKGGRTNGSQMRTRTLRAIKLRDNRRSTPHSRKYA